MKGERPRYKSHLTVTIDCVCCKFGIYFSIICSLNLSKDNLLTNLIWQRPNGKCNVAKW